MPIAQTVDGLMGDKLVLGFVRHLIAKHSDETAEKWLMLRHGLDYGDARAVIRYAQSETATN